MKYEQRKVRLKMSMARVVEGFLFLRNAKKIRNDEFIKHGTMRFSCAKNWIDAEEKYNTGIGDRLEAVYATCHKNSQIQSLGVKKYPDTYSFIDGEYECFRRASVIKLPAYCFYYVTNDSLIEENGFLTHKIDKKFYSDFKIENNSENSILSIRNIDEFITRLKNTLFNIGIKEHEILIEPIHYDSRLRKDIYQFNKESPKELFLKDSSYIHQNEVRIVINTTDTKQIEYLLNNEIYLGDLSDICFSESADKEFDIIIVPKNKD